MRDTLITSIHMRAPCNALIALSAEAQMPHAPLKLAYTRYVLISSIKPLQTQPTANPTFFHNVPWEEIEKSHPAKVSLKWW